MVETYVIIIIVIIAIILIATGAIIGIYFLTKETTESTGPTGGTKPTGPTGHTGVTNTVMRPYPFLSFSQIPAKTKLSRSNIIGNNHFTYTQTYNYALSVQPGGVLIQMTSTMRNQTWYTLVASEIPGLDSFGVYNFYLSLIFVADNSDFLEALFPDRFNNGNLFNNGFSYSTETREGQTVITCPSSKLGLFKIPAGTNAVSITGTNPIYLYGTALVFGFTIPRDDIAQIVAMSELPLTPGNEVNLTTGSDSRLFFYRFNLSTSQVEIILPTSNFSGPIKNSLVNGLGTAVDFNVYTWPTAVRYRRVIVNNGTIQNGQGNPSKLYSVFKSFTSNLAQDASSSRLYNVSITYFVGGTKYLLFSNQVSLHGQNFALFYYAVAPGNNLILYFPQRNVMTNSGEYNTLNKDSVVVEAWFYQ